MIGRPRILIVDDEAGLLQVLGDLFDLEGYEVEACRNAATAREALCRSRFEAALVDVFLSEAPDGIALGEHILTTYPSTSVALMTGFADEADIAASVLSGAFTCIRKPFSLDDALRVVSMALDTQRGRFAG